MTLSLLFLFAFAFGSNKSDNTLSHGLSCLHGRICQDAVTKVRCCERHVVRNSLVRVFVCMC